MSFASERHVKASRTKRQCEVCLKTIEVGEPVNRWAGKYEGIFFTLDFHPECRDAEKEHNEIRGCYGEDWDSLAHTHDLDRAWLNREYPIVAARMGLLGES